MLIKRFSIFIPKISFRYFSTIPALEFTPNHEIMYIKNHYTDNYISSHGKIGFILGGLISTSPFISYLLNPMIGVFMSLFSLYLCPLFLFYFSFKHNLVWEIIWIKDTNLIIIKCLQNGKLVEYKTERESINVIDRSVFETETYEIFVIEFLDLETKSVKEMVLELSVRDDGFVNFDLLKQNFCNE